MSNQFSYELDERQIRLMLRDAEAPYDPSAWSRFEQLAEPDSKPKPSSFNPRINLNISRSVLIPSVFVLLIGGLSATLFSFVDFKKNDINVTKQRLEPQAPKANQTAPKTSERNAVVTETQHSPTPSVVTRPEATEKPVAAVASQESAKSPAAASTNPASTPAPQSVIQTTTVTASNQAKSASVATPVKKRKKREVVSEEIPTIKASSTNLNADNQEPELELR